MPAQSKLSGVVFARNFTERRITADYVADAIRDAINAGSLADGAELNQADLALHFNVSRVPVREALRQLQAEGLVELRAHQLAVVTSLDAHRLSEVYSLRAVIEGWLLEQAASNLTPSDFARARNINEQLKTENSHSTWLDLNAEFHQVLYLPSGASMTLDLLSQLRARSERYARMWSKGTDIQRPRQATEEHELIVSLLEQGKASDAAEAVRKHVLHTRDIVLDFGSRVGREEA